MKVLALLIVLAASAAADLNGFKPIFVPPQEIDRQGISYSTSVHHPDPDPDHPDHHGAQSTIDVTFGAPSSQTVQESRVTNVFNKDYYIPPKTPEHYQKPLQYQHQGGVLTAANAPDSQLFNVGYSVSFAEAKKNLKKGLFRQPDGDIITGTRKGFEAVQKPADFEWHQQNQQNAPAAAVEIIKSDELTVNSATNLRSQQPQQFDHANALGRSIGFDHTNAMEAKNPIYKKYVRPGGTLEKKAEHYFKQQPLRVVHLQTAASGPVPAYERTQGDGQARYEPPKLPIDTRLLRNPVLLSTSDTANYKNDPNVIPIHFDTRPIQDTIQKEQHQQQQPFAFPQHGFHHQEQQNLVRNQPLSYQDAVSQQQGLRAYGARGQSLEKRGGFKKELAPRQPRYTPKVQIQTVLRPPPALYQRKVLVATLH